MNAGSRIAAVLLLNLVLPITVQSAVTINSNRNPNPAPGLESYTLSVNSTAGEIINSFADIEISGVHNVQPPFGQPAVTANQWASDGANGASLAAWSIYDTYVLFDPGSDFAFSVGSLGEVNNGSDPAGLNLTNFGQPATEGLGSFSHALATDQFTIIPGLAGTSVDFMQVVIPEGTSSPISLTVFDTTGTSYEIDSISFPPFFDPNDDSPLVDDLFPDEPWDQQVVATTNAPANYQIQGTDFIDGDDELLSWFLTDFSGPFAGDGSALPGSGNGDQSMNVSGLFEWDPTFSPNGFYFAEVEVLDSNGSTNTGILRIQVPEPSIALLAGLVLVTTLVPRRKFVV